MRVSHSKKSSLDYENIHKVMKTDRPSTKAFTIATETNEGPAGFEPNSTYTCYTLANQHPLRQRPKSRSPYLKSTNTPNKTNISGKASVAYIKTEESGPSDPNDGLILKINQLKIELKNCKEKEKKYLSRINELENDKGILVNSLEKFKRKMNDAVKENKEDKKRMSSIMESFKVTVGDLRRIKTDKDTQTNVGLSIQDRFLKEIGEMNGSIYKTGFSEFLNNLQTKVQEMESYANSAIEENERIRTEIEGYKRMVENLKTSSEHNKIQLKHKEMTQNELVHQNKLLSIDFEYLRQYIKHTENFNRRESGNTTVIGKPSQSDEQVGRKRTQPIPSYVKALSLTLCQNL